CVHGPGLTPGLDLQIQRFQVDVRVGFGEVSGGWELPVGEAEYEFDQAHDARGTFQVADIGLDRTNTQWFLPTLSEHGAERSGFDGIAHRSTSAVQLHVADLGGVRTCSSMGRTQDLLLSGDVGVGQVGGLPGVVHGPTTQDRVDGISVGHGVVEWLEYHDRTTFTTRVTVGPRIEGVAVRVRGEPPELEHPLGALRGQDEVHPTCQSHTALAAAQTLHGHVHADQ